MPLFASLAPPQFFFVVGLEGQGLIIYKIKNRKEVFAVFENALKNGRFHFVTVFYEEEKLIDFIKRRKVFEWYKMETV
jgi:hypothetical protein